jgi:hypothetical protein
LFFRSGVGHFLFSSARIEVVAVAKRAHVAILRGKLGGVNFRLCCASTRQAALRSRIKIGAISV